MVVYDLFHYSRPKALKIIALAEAMPRTGQMGAILDAADLMKLLWESVLGIHDRVETGSREQVFLLSSVFSVGLV